MKRSREIWFSAVSHMFGQYCTCDAFKAHIWGDISCEAFMTRMILDISYVRRLGHMCLSEVLHEMRSRPLWFLEVVHVIHPRLIQF